MIKLKYNGIMRLCKFLILFCALFCFKGVLAQSELDESRISCAVVVEEGIPEEACRYLQNKMMQALSINGFIDYGYTNRFVLAAKVDIVSSDVVTSMPSRISQKIEITFIIGDVIENKVYSTCSVSLIGIGVNDVKSFMSAFSNIDSDQEDLQSMLKEAKEKILGFYSTYCDEIMIKAQTLASVQKYDEAIFRLMSVPNVCSDCYKKCQEKAVSIYEQKINAESVLLLNQAKAIWMKQPDAMGAQEVAQVISHINPKAQNYDEIVAFRTDVSSKLDSDAKREWDFRMKQYDDSQDLKRSIIEACKAIGVAYGKGQPQNITRIVVHRWW